MVGDGVLPLQILITSSRLELGKELFPGGRLVQSFLRLPNFGSAQLAETWITRSPDHQRAKCSAESCSMERVCDGEEEEEKEGPRPCQKTYLQFGSLSLEGAQYHISYLPATDKLFSHFELFHKQSRPPEMNAF